MIVISAPVLIQPATKMLTLISNPINVPSFQSLEAFLMNIQFHLHKSSHDLSEFSPDFHPPYIYQHQAK